MEEEDKVALWNAAMGVTIRLNHILDLCWMASENLDTYGWFRHLKSFQRESWSKMSEEEKNCTSHRYRAGVEMKYMIMKRIGR